MGNRSFFNALHDREGDFLLATVLEGPAQGERVLLRNTAPVWPEKLPAFWGEHLPALAAVTSSGILKSAGQRIFVERFGAAPQLVVCGGGHVGASVVRLAKLLGLPVTALEDRPEFAEELRQAGADAVLCLPFAEGLAQIPGGQETYFVVVTRAHSCDIACLRSILQKPAAYVGMMGSRKRAALVHTQLAELGLPQERIDALHAPIGLSIGAKTAQEIALSILAEIVSVKNSRQQTEGFSPALLAALEQQTAPAVLATIVGRHGSTPREEGSKMLVLPDGSAVGSVGGGIMEYRTQQLARELLEPGAAPCRLAAFTTEGASDAAAIAACGGSMEVFLQRLEPDGGAMKRADLIVVRGGGDLATGGVHRLWSAGLRVLVLETAHPAAIRRQVSLCEAVYEGETAVEGMRGIRVETLADADAVWAQNAVPILIDPTGACLPQARPAVLVDAIIAKKNLGTTREMAPLTIALGPGFSAGQDVDVVVETKRGHKLGRIIREGSAAPNSGVPGIIGGYGAERVLHAQAAGIFRNLHSIADFVEAGEAVAEIETPDGQRLPVVTQISGILRGLLRDGYPVTKGFKVADVDPRSAELENCFLISDKARCIAGSVLELITAACWN